MPSISTLILDVQEFLKSKQPWTVPEIPFNKIPRKPGLSLSQMGDRCPCALWHSVHHPELAEELPPWAIFKYNYGHIIEASAIVLAKMAGHLVEGEQDEIFVDGVVGHRDCIIDGCLVDVKSANSRGYPKFKDGSIESNDTFGYLAQLDGYLAGGAEDPILKVKDKAYLWAIDKELGHMCLHEHKVKTFDSIRSRIFEYKSICGLSKPPQCNCGTIDDGKSGNIKLDVRASYNAFKYSCFPRLRTFLYAEGPRYLTVVRKRPVRQDGTLITEVDRHGKIIYT